MDLVLVFAALMGFAILLYVLLDGYDLGIGMLMPAASREEQELHLRAQRFARVHVAGIRLHKSEKVKEGRIQHALYASLKTEIDSARDVFQRDFLPISPTMVDYLHLELLRTLANENAELLGPDYPGPMV